MPMLSARALAADIRSGRLSPFGVLEQCAETIAAHESQVHAFATLGLAVAGAAARAADAASPLAGLPIGVKDVIDTRDLVTSYGSPLYEGHRPVADAAVVRLVRRAGGGIAGKTTTTEFGFMQPASTCNPLRLTHTPGGSSSGSAAAVAAGMLPLAIGTQSGGSVIRPASFCGVTGYKPTFRLMPTVGMKTTSWHLDTLGLFGARVADVAFGAAAITGRDLDIGDDVAATPRIGIVMTARDDLASAESHAALARAAQAAEQAGARVRAVGLPPELEAAHAAHGTIRDFEGALSLADEFDFNRDRLSPLLAAHLARAAEITPATYDEARCTAKRARQHLGDLFADFDALLTFSALGEAPEGLASTGSAEFNRLWTLMGTPTINVTGCTGPSGLPVGVQVVGRFGRDRAALLVAALVEQALST